MIPAQVGTTLGSLTLKVGGETLSPSEPQVLSCGGVFFPRRAIPVELRTWRQIIHLPGDQLSAKVVGLKPQEPQEALFILLQKEGMN